MFCGRFIYSLESGEKIRDVFRLDADTRIRDHVDHVAGLVFLHLTLHGKGDGTFLGVLDRIVNDIDKDLLDADFIAYELGRDLR